MLYRLCLVLSLLIPSVTAFSEIAVIVKKDVPDTDVGKDEIANIFLGRSKVLPSGTSVKPVDLPKEVPIRAEFYEKVAGKSVRAVVAAWAKLVFTGRAKAPAEKNTAAEIKAYVNSEGGIGYINASDVDDSVKVIFKVP